MKSIYEQIEMQVRQTGGLPGDFKLTDATKPSDYIQTQLGELEGLVGSKISALVDEDALNTCLNMIKENLEIAPKLAVHNFDDYDFGFSVASIRGHLLKRIIENMLDFDPHKLSTLAYSLMMFGTKTETVKLGLLLLLLFDFANDEVAKKHLVTIGLYEDFTSYVISNTKSFADEYKNHVYYVYAKKLKGWGKVNAVSALEPVNDEVKEWLLCEGCKNDISYALVAQNIADKIDLVNVLKTGSLDDKEIVGVRNIVYGLLEGDNGCQISEYGSPSQFIALYISEMVKHKVELEDIANLYRMERYLENYDKKSERAIAERVIVQIEKILSDYPIEETIVKTLMNNPGIAVRTAMEGSIDISDELLSLLSKDFDAYYQYGNYFFNMNIGVKEFVDICTQPVIDGCSPDMLLKSLGKYPGVGVEIIRHCINSSMYYYRIEAADVLLMWEETSSCNIKKINSDLFKEIKKLKKKETSDRLKVKWDEIISYK